jgi:hypothetical protein
MAQNCRVAGSTSPPSVLYRGYYPDDVESPISLHQQVEPPHTSAASAVGNSDGPGYRAAAPLLIDPVDERRG